MYIQTLLAERQATHGDFQATSAAVQQLKYVMSTVLAHKPKPLTSPQSEALDMIAHKIGRILCGDANLKDHWDDIAGYATLISNTLKPSDSPATQDTSDDDLDW